MMNLVIMSKNTNFVYISPFIIKFVYEKVHWLEKNKYNEVRVRAFAYLNSDFNGEREYIWLNWGASIQ